MARVTIEDCLDNVDNRFALVILGAEQVVLVLLGAQRDENTFVYLLRLLAFALIAIAILLKNRTPRGKGRQG